MSTQLAITIMALITAVCVLIAATFNAHAAMIKVDPVRRPQDLVDIRALLTHLDAGERERARSGLGLITARGFQRGRDRLADFEVLWQEHAESASAE